MKIFILIFILGIVALFISLYWLIINGLKNKFGYEWIPWEIGIEFDYFNIIEENKKIIRFSLLEHEIEKFDTQFYRNVKSVDINSDNENKDSKWFKVDFNTYEFRNLKNDKLIAILDLKLHELIYFK